MTDLPHIASRLFGTPLLVARPKPRFDNAVAAILVRLRLSRMVCSDATSVRIDGRTAWNWVFQNDQVVIHVIRKSRAAAVIGEVMGGRRPVIWGSDLYGAQQGHADLWQVCLAHQLRDCKSAPFFGLRARPGTSATD